MIYNTMKHDIRNKAGLSMLDYCILEMIYHLSTSGKEQYKTWCNAPKDSFSHLSVTARTLVNRFKDLESKGWLEFKDSKRLLKRTTKKYFNEVYCYISGVKKFHSEKISPMKKLHPEGEKISQEAVKKLHSEGEKISPNNNISNINKNINKEERIKELEQQLFELKNQDAKEKKKSCAKKEKTPHVFPDISPRKSYKVQEEEIEKDPRDMRINTHLPFSKFKSEAIATLEAIYPKNNNYQLLIDCQQKNNGLHPTDDQLALCRDSYIKAGLDQYQFLSVITDINLFQEQFIKWIPKHLKFMERGKKFKKTNRKSNPDKRNGIDVNYSKDKGSEMAAKYG
jgi:hypothetical protein